MSDGAVTLVVGADKGIGHCAAIELHDRGDRVVAACLGDGAELAARGIEVHADLDVTSDSSVARLAAALETAQTPLGWLFHVAGVLALDDLETVDFDEARREFEVNSLGPLRVVRALRSRLHEGSKVGIVTSRVASLGDNGSGLNYAYRMSKAAANMAGLNLSHELRGQGVAVIMLHPGMVATDLTKDLGGAYATAEYITPEVAAHGLIHNMDGLSLETSGRFQHANGEYLPW